MDTAASYQNIGLVYNNYGEFDKALEYYSKALKIYESSLWINHHEATSLLDLIIEVKSNIN